MDSMGHFLPLQWLYPGKKEWEAAAGKESNNCVWDDNDYNKCQYQKKKRDPLITWLRKRRLLCSATLNGSTPEERRQWMGNNNDYLARVSPHQLALLLSKEEMDHVVSSSLLESTAFHIEQSFLTLVFLFKTFSVISIHAQCLIITHLKIQTLRMPDAFCNFHTHCVTFLLDGLRIIQFESCHLPQEIRNQPQSFVV